MAKIAIVRDKVFKITPMLDNVVTEINKPKGLPKSTLQMELHISYELQQSIVDSGLSQYSFTVDCCDITEATIVDVYVHEEGNKKFIKSISTDRYYLSVVDKALSFIELREERLANE